MSRHKYRVWVTEGEEKGWFNGSAFLMLSSGNLIQENPVFCGWLYITGKPILMQCTGLPDKHDKLMYEYDIVNAGQHTPTGSFFRNYLLMYRQSEGCYWLMSRGTKFRVTERQIKQYNFQVVGNVFDNPELIEGDLEWVISHHSLDEIAFCLTS